MTATVARTDVYTDPQGLGELKVKARSGEDLATLREVAGQFEALFIQMMLKSMRDARLGEGIFDSDQGDTYQSLFDQQISIELAGQQSLGLADMMIEQLRPQAPGRSPEGDEPVLPVTRSNPQRPGAVRAAVAANTTIGASGASDWNPGSPADFIRLVRPHAEKAAKELGVDPEVLIAQAALETGWGQSMVRDGAGRNSFNFFGIKADPSWSGERVSTGTVEFRDGVMQRERTAFRAYATPAESFSDYAAFLKQNPRYEQALAVASDNGRFLQELQRAGYATDPEYANKISAITESEPFRESVTEFKKQPHGTLG
jgi:flagellar protein FlgJ